MLLDALRGTYTIVHPRYVLAGLPAALLMVDLITLLGITSNFAGTNSGAKIEARGFYDDTM